jgi:hypothetical protein
MSSVTDNPKKITWYLTVAEVLFIFVLVGVYSARIAHETTGYDDDQAKTRLATLHKMQAADEKTLNTADWIDQDKGIVRIPVNEAVTEEVPVLAAKPVTMGAAIPGTTAANTVPATNAAPADNPPAPAAAGAKPAAPAANAAPTGNARPATKQPSK